MCRVPDTYCNLQLLVFLKYFFLSAACFNIFFFVFRYKSQGLTSRSFRVLTQWPQKTTFLNSFCQVSQGKDLFSSCVSSLSLTHRSFSSRLHWANEHGPHSSISHGWHGGPPVSHQHLQAATVPHVHLGLTHERPCLALPCHYIFSGLALCIAAVHTQHELWTTQQSTGENMCGCFDVHKVAVDRCFKGFSISVKLNFIFCLRKV